MKAMDIEVVDIRKMGGEGTLRAFADVRVGGAVVVKGFSVIHGKNGLFVSMPKKQGRDGSWFEIVSTETDELKQEIQDKVMEAYDRQSDAVDG